MAHTSATTCEKMCQKYTKNYLKCHPSRPTSDTRASNEKKNDGTVDFF